MNHKIFTLILSSIIIIILVGLMPVMSVTAGQTLTEPGDIASMSPPDAQSPAIWFPVRRNGFGNPAVKQIFALEEFKGALYAVASSSSSPITFWRTTDGLQWELLPQVGLNGDPTPNNYSMAVNDLHVYQNKLYVGTTETPVTNQSMLWRSSDGTTWELIESAGFNSEEDITVMYTASNNDFYLATYNGIYKSSTGDPGSWNKVFNPDMHNNGVWSMIDYKGVLYAGGEASSGSVMVFSNSGSGGDWILSSLNSTVGTPNTEIGGFVVFKNELYVGTKNISGGEIWKRNNGGTWSQVQTRVNGAVKKNGLGNPANEKAEAFIVYNDKLYLVMNNTATGVQIWVTENGVDWQNILDARVRKPKTIYTHWNNALVEFDGRLYLGTGVHNSEPVGGEIWAFPGWKAIYLPLIVR